MNDERDDPARGRHSRQPEGRNPGSPDDRATPPTSRQQAPRSQGPPPSGGTPPGARPPGPQNQNPAPPGGQRPGGQQQRPQGPPPGAPQNPPPGRGAGQRPAGPPPGQGQGGAQQRPGEGTRQQPPPGRPRQGGDQPQWPGESAPPRGSGKDAEAPSEQTGAWTPSFDDEDDAPTGKRAAADSGESGRKLDLPTSFTKQPPPAPDQRAQRQAGAGQQGQPGSQQSGAAQQPGSPQQPASPDQQSTQQFEPQRPGQQPTRQVPPPPPGQQSTRQVPPPPGRPSQAAVPPGERPTENIPQTPGDGKDQGRGRGRGAAAAGGVVGGVAGAAALGGAAAAAGGGAAGGAAGAAGAGAAGAAGMGAGSGASGNDAPREPQLLTHEATQSSYDYYSSDPYSEGGRYDDYDDGYDDGRYGDGGHGDDGYGPDDELLDPDDELSARKAKRKVIWRRIRRSCYVAAAAMLLIGIGTFAYGYAMWPVPNPEEIASKTEQTITINYSNGQELTRVEPEGGSMTMIRDLDAEVSKPMRDATVAAEDATFYTNPGFSIRGIMVAVYNQIAGGAGGGSTLTQQYVKLALDADEYSITRKVKEVVVAYKVTNQQSKDDILKAYMNTAYYGRGANGIHAAAEAYFGKLPKDLNPSEAAVLAGMVQRPTDNDPRVDQEQGQWRWTYVADQMLKNNFVTQDVRAGMALPETRERDAWKSKPDGNASQLHIRKQVLAELEREGYDEQALTLGGYTITTTIDPAAQKSAEDAVTKVLNGQPQNLRTSLVAVDPKTGGVRAYYGGGNEVYFDYADSPQPPGSSFKPFVVMAGLEKDYGIGEYYDGSDHQEILGTTFGNAPGSVCDNPKYCGVREAMDKSVNTVFVRMAEKFGTPSVREAAIQAGIPAEYNGEPTLQNSEGGVDAGIALGAYPVRTVDMAAAYATFANEGKQVHPQFVQKIQNAVKTEEFAPEPSKPAFADSASESKNLAANVIESMLGVADRAKLSLNKDRPVAAKTGTHQYFDTEKNQNAWMIGTTPQLSAAVGMLADQDGKPIPVEEASGKIIYGSGLPGDIWQEFMNSYHQNLPVEQFPKPSPIGQFEQKLPPTPTTTSAPPPPPPTSAPPETSTQPPTSSESETSESESESSDPSGDCGWLGCPPGSGNDEGGPGNDGPGGANGVAPTRGRDGE
ncbi:transglycosylase domain-containing protein [Saccharopolyspora sp. NPDC002578]